MSVKRATLYSGGALLVLAWLASAAGLARQSADQVDPPRPTSPDPTLTLADEVQAQTVRLKTRLAVAPTPQEPYRNAFAFASRPEPARPRVPSVDRDVPAVAAPPAEPAIELIGVAQSETPEGVTRTAIISTLSGDLFLVKEGETIAARYRVGVVSENAVELNDLLLGTLRRLALRD
jgi:hypothetical protein